MLDVSKSPMVVPPQDIQRDWMLSLQHPSGYRSTFVVLDIRRTEPGSSEEQRIIARVVDEAGRPLADVDVVFAFSTGQQIIFPPTMQWAPPAPHNGGVVKTDLGGTCDFIQGSAVKPGQPGGMTVYCLDPNYPSVVVQGAGMLANHEGLCITFQLRRDGYTVGDLAQRVSLLEDAVRQLSQNA